VGGGRTWRRAEAGRNRPLRVIWRSASSACRRRTAPAPRAFMAGGVNRACGRRNRATRTGAVVGATRRESSTCSIALVPEARRASAIDRGRGSQAL
jgi:hypothetical protein